MITCSINGKAAYPLTSDKIKLTFENPYIKDSGEYSYEITFPMELPEHRSIFGNVQRMDVNKKMPSYEDCKLYADNRLIISGKGVVTNITERQVKLQIVGGKSRIKYNSKWEKHYIDEIDYLDGKRVVDMIDSGFDTRLKRRDGIIWTKDETTTFLGCKGKFVFNTAYDENTEDFVNVRIPNLFESDGTYVYDTKKVDYPIKNVGFLYRPAIQPNLLFVLEKVLEYEGVKIALNELISTMMGNIYISNVYPTLKIHETLPHWTVYKFIEEVACLFGVTFIFDDTYSTVDITMNTPVETEGMVEYECADDFSTDYEDDAQEVAFFENISYAEDESASREWGEFIPLSLLDKFKVEEVMMLPPTDPSTDKETRKQQLRTIYKTLSGELYCYYTHLDDNGNPDKTYLRQIGVFRPLQLDESSDNATELNIIPVAMAEKTVHIKGMGLYNLLVKYDRLVPCMPNEKGVPDIEDTALSDDEEYTTVQDVIDGDKDTEVAEDTTPIRIFIQTVEPTKEKTSLFCYTHRMQVLVYGKDGILTDTGSLSLRSVHSIPDYKLDTHNLVNIKFFCDGIPSVKHIYNFANKKFIASKIECNITNGMVEQLKTGYFYEIS